MVLPPRTLPSTAPSASSPSHERDQDRVLPLPGWLTKLYLVFPVVLYVPDITFNYVVYSAGVQPKDNAVLYVASVVLWSFLSVGVVGMAYLLSVLAPWHWGQGHRIQAFFCGLGVMVATAITTWNSLAFRSRDFVTFPTDEWVYSIWPQLKADSVSITMILVAIAPPFWGLFWAIVQPTEMGRSLRQLQESHEERLLRMQQEADVKRLKAETNAKVREAQLRGMAATAAAARQQAVHLLKTQANAERMAAAATQPYGVNTTYPASTVPLDEHAITGGNTLPATTEPPLASNATTSIRQFAGDVDEKTGLVEQKRPLTIGSWGKFTPLKPGTKSFARAVRNTILTMQQNSEARTFFSIARRMAAAGDQVDPQDVKAAFDAMRRERLNKLRPGAHAAPDPALDDAALLLDNAATR